MDNLNSGIILVTGAAGFIGSALIAELNNRGYDNIIACDHLSNNENFLNLVGLRFDDYIDSEDLLDIIDDNKNVLNISCIFHLGACAVTTETDCNYLIRNNYEYSKSLACFAADNNIRFVYASSAATYGDGSIGMLDTMSNLQDLRPLNMYAYSKHLFDLFAQKNNIPGYGMKYFNVFGPNEYHKGNMRSVVLKSCEMIQATGRMQLFKSKNSNYQDGHQLRDFLYIKDAIDMTIFFANIDAQVNSKSTDGLYNIATGEAHTWIELITPVFYAIDKPVNIEYIDMPEKLASKYQYYTLGKIDKIRNLGYTGQIRSLTESVTDYVKNYILPGNKRLQDIKI